MFRLYRAIIRPFYRNRSISNNQVLWSWIHWRHPREIILKQTINNYGVIMWGSSALVLSSLTVSEGDNIKTDHQTMTVWGSGMGSSASVLSSLTVSEGDNIKTDHQTMMVWRSGMGSGASVLSSLTVSEGDNIKTDHQTMMVWRSGMGSSASVLSSTMASCELPVA